MAQALDGSQHAAIEWIDPIDDLIEIVDLTGELTVDGEIRGEAVMDWVMTASKATNNRATYEGTVNGRDLHGL